MVPILQATVGLMGVLLLAVAGLALWLRSRIADGRIADGMDSPYPVPERGPADSPTVDAGPWDGVTTWIEASAPPVSRVVGAEVATDSTTRLEGDEHAAETESVSEPRQ